MKRLTVKTMNKPIVIRILTALGVYVLLLLVGCVITTGLVGSEKIPIESCKYGVVLTLLISILAATKILLRSEDRRRYLAPVATTVGALLVLAVGNLILGAEDMSGFVPTALVTAGGAACSLLTKGKNRRVSYKKKFA